MPALAVPFLVSYSLQLAALVCVIRVSLLVVARQAPGIRLGAWRGALVAACLLPLTIFLPVPAWPAAEGAVTLSMAIAQTEPSVAVREIVSWPRWLPWLVLAGIGVRSLWLGAGWHRLRRRFGGAPDATSPLFDEIRTGLEANARLIWDASSPQPFTFGTSPAVVVVPAMLASAPDATQRAVFTHELLHVARRDWRSVVVEEIARAVLWFHPAVWVLVRELRQAREEIVDRAVVKQTGARRTYVATLLALADRTPLSMQPGLPFFRSRQLTRRVAALASEVSMSTLRLLVTSAAVLTMSVTAVVEAARAFPMPAAEWSGALQQDAAPPNDGVQSSEPGPLERTAYVAPKDAPPPVRTRFVAPTLPAGAKGMNRTELDLRFVVDSSGRVVEARLLKWSIAAPMNIEQKPFEGALYAVLAAVRQWQFEPPALAPLAVTATLTLDPATGEAGAASSERPLCMEIKKAVYPEVALTQRIQGDVELEATIDPTGHVSAVRVVRSVMPEIDDAAVTAVRQSTFRPGMKNGRPVSAKVTLTMKFALK
jgi:TonB family protein